MSNYDLSKFRDYQKQPIIKGIEFFASPKKDKKGLKHKKKLCANIACFLQQT